ncbi:hypothetical protein QWY87_05015 [Lutimonas halocynthiae]|uniref:DUF7670 domain-containing protein n=1 Tax=Lutimonas halocynthiae TaxID=1446477 RepID=UPI0025B3CEB6|nr:hypothetical protein [Lutimonas halocynthiae]MDN3642049.1 hypothetical protein [Lutimonas halocynthiae]
MKKLKPFLYWFPRILCILAILFVSVFALDAFQPELTFWQQIQGFMMHLIPSFVLLFFLLIAWNWELIGGVIFVLIGLVLSPFIYMHNYNMNGSVWMSFGIIAMITFPFILVGILFIVGHKMNKNQVDIKA